MKRISLILLLLFSCAAWGQVDSLDILSDNGILINNKIQSYTSIQQLLKFFSKPDSIVVKTFQCGGYFEAKKISMYYYGETSFETLGDTAVLRVLNFEDGRFKLNTPKLILDKTTTFNEFKKLFPVSSNNANDWVDQTDKKTYKLVWMKLTNKHSSDRWKLMFFNGKLIKIEYWLDC